MKKQVYITEEECAKCQKVVDAFAELYELENIVVLDVGRYGFVELKYYKPPHGFEDAITFTDSVALFEDLWEEWLNTKLYLLAKGTPLLEKGYCDLLEYLSQRAVISEVFCDGVG